MDTVLSDVRYSLRLLRRNPGFTAVAVLTLALGIGANTTMFGVVSATLLKPLPFPGSDRLVMVWEGRVDEPNDLNIVSWPNFRDWREQSRVFENLAMFDSAGRGYNLGGGNEPEQVSGVRVTASFFPTLGVAPSLGRTFLPEEETAGRDRVVVLSHGLWTRRYGADPALVGKAIKIDTEDVTVVGVMPKSFEFRFWSGPRELWVPVGYTEGDQSRGSHSFIAFARLKSHVALAEARAEMDTIGRRLAQEHSAENAGETVRLEPMGETGLRSLRPALFALLGVVGFVLLIASVNVANLMLARAAARHKELAVR